MFNKSYITIVIGLISMMIASGIFYFDHRSLAAFIIFAIGFVLVGIGILLGFFKMIRESKE
jgi:hypothetical protein